MEQEQQRRIVEAVVLAAPEPISAARIAELLPRCNPSQVRARIAELNAAYADARHAFEIWEVAGGYQLRSLPEFAPYLKQIQKTSPLRLSSAALESLAVVAYRQPVTRAEIDQVRGVDSGAVLRGLLDRDLIRIAGHRDLPGRPIVYATSRRFLEVFGLGKLGDLPDLREVEELGAAEGDVQGGQEVQLERAGGNASLAESPGQAAPSESEAETGPDESIPTASDAGTSGEEGSSSEKGRARRVSSAAGSRSGRAGLRVVPPPDPAF
ncbi:MAG: SMC-Scp complex subunit ScpB [Myxococcota bacterium]